MWTTASSPSPSSSSSPHTSTACPNPTNASTHAALFAPHWTTTRRQAPPKPSPVDSAALALERVQHERTKAQLSHERDQRQRTIKALAATQEALSNTLHQHQLYEYITKNQLSSARAALKTRLCEPELPKLNKDLATRNQQLDMRNEVLNKRLEDLGARNEELGTHIEQLATHIEELGERATKLEREIVSERTAHAATRNERDHLASRNEDFVRWIRLVTKTFADATRTLARERASQTAAKGEAESNLEVDHLARRVRELEIALGEETAAKHKMEERAIAAEKTLDVACATGATNPPVAANSHSGCNNADFARHLHEYAW